MEDKTRYEEKKKAIFRELQSTDINYPNCLEK